MPPSHVDVVVNVPQDFSDTIHDMIEPDILFQRVGTGQIILRSSFARQTACWSAIKKCSHLKSRWQSILLDIIELPHAGNDSLLCIRIATIFFEISLHWNVLLPALHRINTRL